jgi:hypothetical protein
MDMAGNRAIDRLDEPLRHKLDNIIASYKMERMTLSEAEIEILAQYLLGEISAEESRARMAALPQ